MDYDLITLEGKLKNTRLLRRLRDHRVRPLSRAEIIRQFDLGFTTDDLDETDFSGIKKAVKKAAKKTKSAAQKTVTAAKTSATRSAQKTITAAKTKTQAAVTQAQTQAKKAAQHKINTIKQKVKSLPQAAKAYGANIIAQTVQNYKNYPKLTGQRLKNYVTQVVSNPDTMLQIASQADIPIVSGVIKSYMDASAMMQQGMTMEEILAQNPELAEMLQSPQAAAVMAVAQNPSPETVAAVAQDVPNLTAQLQQLLNQVQTTLQVNAPAIMERVFNIFDLVEEGKLE